MKKLLIFALIGIFLLTGCTRLPETSETPPLNETQKPTLGSESIPTTVSAQFKIAGQVGGPTQAVAVQGDYAYVGVGMRLVILAVSNPAAPKEVGAREPFGWYIEDVAVVGNMAFVAAGGAGLYIIDVSNPTSPIAVGSYDTSGYAEAVFVSGKYAYIADGPDGLRVIDTTDRSHPVEVATAYKLNYAFDVFIQDTNAYTAAAGAGLLVADISDPAKPKEVGSLDTPGYAYGVTVSGNTAYVADGWGGLRIEDISNPSNPFEVSSIETSGWALAVEIDNNYAYIAAATSGLIVVDISDRTNPHEIGESTENESTTTSINIDGNASDWNGIDPIVTDPTGILKALYVTNDNEFVYFMLDFGGQQPSSNGDISVDLNKDGTSDHNIHFNSPIGPPSKPPGLFGIIGSDINAELLRISDSIASGKVAEWRFPLEDFPASGFAVTEINIPPYRWTGYAEVIFKASTSHTSAGRLATLGNNYTKLAISEDIAYIADRNLGIEIFELSQPANPVRVYLYSPMGFVDAVAVSGNYAYVAAGLGGVRVVDISDLSHPREIGAYETNAYATGIVVLGDYAYVITYASTVVSSGLHIINVSNPSEPKEESFYAIRGMAQDIVVSGNIAYIADEWGLVLIDVSNPASPLELSSMDFAHGDAAQATMATWGVDVSGDMAYVTHGDKLEVIDVSNPRKPVMVGFYKPPERTKSGAVTVGGNFAYVTMVPGLQVVDISDPKNPKGVGSYNLSAPERLAFTNDTIYVASSGGGLLALDVTDPMKPTQAGVQRLPGYAVGLTTAGNHIYVADGEGGLFIVKDGRKPSEIQQTSSAQSKISGERSPDIAGFTNSQEPDGKLGSKANSKGDTAHFSSGRTITVTNSMDSGQGTLRGALENVGSGDTITFDPSIFPPKNPVTIRLTSGLFWTPGSVTIDASEAGVILDGTGTTSHTSGLDIKSNYNIIKGLQIINFSGNGIQLVGANNTIGGDRSRGRGPMGEGNLISGNGDFGIIIIGSQATGNKVIGNYIGTDVSGKRTLGNRNTGIFLSHQASQNIIGGKTEAERNIISGNGRAEISLMNQANANIVTGNYIGTDASGMTTLGNVAMAGISIELGGFSNIIERNVISNEGHIGVIISDWGSWYNEIIGNHIGVDATGSVSLGGKGAGVHVNASFNKVGGTTPDERNVISGNADQGVKIGWWGTTDVLILGNYIGTDVTGLKPIANGIGILIGYGTQRTFVGGSTNSEQNLISGNDHGLNIDSMGTDYNFVTGNYIGTSANGTSALANGKVGIQINAGDHNFILSNLIAYNQSGVIIKPGDWNRLHHNTLVQNGKNSDGGNNNLWNDGREGNYWSEYKGNDKNADGIGDMPYSVPPNGVDNYPLMKPYQMVAK